MRTMERRICHHVVIAIEAIIEVIVIIFYNSPDNQEALFPLIPFS
jgi:hypothetical protein